MILDVHNLTKSYNNKTVVDNISFSIDKNEIFGLLGKSGAGKTTTIKILTSQIKRDGGDVHILDKDIDKWTKRDNIRLGIMTDDFGVYERLTCIENLKLFESIYRIPGGRAMDILKKVGLYEAQNKKVYELSKGMKQRLCLAKAIIHSPEILFLDEPTSDLDPSTTNTIHEILKDLNDNGTMIFLTTHDMDEACKLCNKVGVINKGKMVAYGNPVDLCYGADQLRNITIVDKQKRVHIIENKVENAKQIADFFEKDNVLSIKSSEPDLEQLFIKLIEESDNL